MKIIRIVIVLLLIIGLIVIYNMSKSHKESITYEEWLALNTNSYTELTNTVTMYYKESNDAYIDTYTILVNINGKELKSNLQVEGKKLLVKELSIKGENLEGVLKSGDIVSEDFKANKKTYLE